MNLAAQSQSNQRQTHGTSIVEDLGLSDSFREMEGISAEPLRVEEAVTSLQSDVMEELRHHTRCVLLGGAGAGKTTVIEKLALDSAKKRLQNTRGPIPVFLRLSLWTDQVSAMEFVRTHWPLASDPDTAIPRGDAVVFLDALNEVGASAVEKSKMLREWIDSPEGPKSIYVTCRTDDYVLSELDLGVPVIELQEMDEARIKELATQYFERYGEDSGPFLSQILPSSENRTGLLYGLAQNPYMLTAMIVSYLTDLKSSSTSTANLPQNLGLLSKKLINSLWTWEGERRSKGWLSYDEMERQFSRLAFNMIDNNQPTSVPLDYAYEYCQPELLRVAKSAHIVESDDDNVRFYHQLMQEYFAAVQLKKMGVSTRLQAPTLESGERRATAWDQVIIAMCGFVNDPDKVVTQILMNDDPYLAAMCIASGVDVGQNTIDNTVGGLLAAMDGWWNIGGRLDVASKALEQIGQPAVPALRQALKDKDTSTRLKTNVVRTLVHLQDRFWAMSCSAAYESAERTTRSLVNAHKASLSITQKVS